MATEAEKNAKRRYKQRIKEEGKLHRLYLDLYPGDSDIYEWLQDHKPVATYIKELIRNDMHNG